MILVFIPFQIMPRKSVTIVATKNPIDEAIEEIVKTPEEINEELPTNAPAIKTRNCFTKEEAAQKRNIRQIYPEYYKLYERRTRLLRNLKKENITEAQRNEYNQALVEVENDLKQCENKPKRSKFSH